MYTLDFSIPVRAKTSEELLFRNNFVFSCPVPLLGSILAGYENATLQRDRLFI